MTESRPDAELDADVRGLPERRGAGLELERRRVFAALREKMFGESEPTRVGRFHILERRGFGAMGIVYGAYDPQLDRKVALKLVHGHRAEAEARIDREARALARLRHPNVVTVYEIGEHQGHRFIAMDLVEGATLREWLATKPGWRSVLDVMLQAGHGLAAAHAAGLVHRDFKPDNVLVEDGHAKVVDFGFARPPGVDPTQESDEALEAPALEVITRSGVIAGTPAYMAPEALRGEVDERGDQFAYCVTLYEAIHGVLPFSAMTVPARLVAIEEGRLEPGSARSGAPAWLQRAIARGLAADPEERWESMQALLWGLERRRRRPGRTVALGTAVGGLAVGAALVGWPGRQGASPCERAGEAMDQVWHQSRRDAIEGAFVATGLGHAIETWTRVGATMDDYAEAWVDARREACEATHERGEQSERLLDARMACLDQGLDELDSLATLLTTPSESVISGAVVAGKGLMRLEQCRDVDELGRPRGRLARASAQRAPRELYARMARVHVLWSAGQYDDAFEEVVGLAEEAEAADDRALASRAQRTLAAIEIRRARLEQAQAAVEAALVYAEAIGDDGLRADAQLLLISLLVRLRPLERAEDWITPTRAVLEHIAAPAEQHARLISLEGSVHRAAGRYEEALARLREAFDLRNSHLDPDDPRLADTLYGIGRVLAELGRLEESLRTMEQVVELRIDQLGEHHPQVAKARNILGSTLRKLGRLDEATEQYRIVIDTASRGLGPNHPLVAYANVNLGSTLAQGDDRDTAVPYLRRGVELLEAIHGPEHIDVADALSNLGRLLAFSDRPHDAVGVLERALKIREAIDGPMHPENIDVLNSLAAAHRRAGDPGRAAEASRRSIEIALASVGEDHPLVALAWREVGEAERARGQPHAAIEALRRAASIHERIESRPAERGMVYFELAKALRETGREREALVEVERARQALSADPVDQRVRLGWIEEWLAEGRPAHSSTQ